MITYHIEKWSTYYADPDRERLWQEHYAEFEPAHEHQMDMSPDVEFYAHAAARGHLVVIVARDMGRMIGYCLTFVRRHIHYNTLCGFEDSYYVTRSKRLGLLGGRIGIGLIEATCSELRRRGCKRVYFMTKEFLSIATLLEHQGFARIDSVWARWL